MAAQFNLADLFEIVADKVPEREALVCGNNRSSFAELDAGANQMAHYLAANGVKAGDHVGLYMYNCSEYLEAMLACFKIRAVPINVNYRYVKDELLYIFDNADMVACIHHREFIPAIADVRSAAKTLKLYISVADDSDADLSSIDAVDYHTAREGQNKNRDFAERSADDYFILYTGGTTGMPKGVMWPHENVFFAAMGGGGHFSPLGACEKPEDIASRVTENPLRGIALAPLMHGASWWYACIQLLAGNTLILNHQRSFNGEAVWQIVADEKVNAVQIVGDAMAIPLLDALVDNEDRWDLSAVFNVGSGGAIFSEAKQEAFKKYFPNVFITNSFGSSEGGQMGMDNGSKKTASGLGNVTRTDFMDVIVDADGASPRHAELGESGIFARAGYIPNGYYNDPEKTAKTFIQVEGKTWLLTGDEAKLESDGSITVFGRGSNCINSGGEKIFPEEVEDALKAHGGIFDALVVGVDDERWGSRVSAIIQARKGVDLNLDNIQEHCRQHIAGYKVPREIHLIDELPRAPSGKPDYKTAKKFAESGKGAVA
ncbi:3-oxocholest-4-en-26-oate--CoA ligase [Zhongshania aliphaticivorans]|uniref:3-oxocholest-4-en-26-oate--CoA ligase n=1 Tax=Zhongshania aliphaticivorans TaxID=1470434 RepID=A0A5S9Q3H2_9GAMM|nr:acyl-CoA synthetase [Zhongshania aliphaticivorans]CAA0093762.1 3-oxocholest-4-en-26-oate--CoA ligase [Zhongshania aliphaticivorans]CAA0111796.1 3-oxocholest-4-en-26-oate--CoA ligase [Zhongshania aliphaticivorans]